MSGAGVRVIAIDGPAGSGKSTIARQVARALGARYLDTGAMYRALTWAVLESGAEPDDPGAVEKVLASFDLSVGTDADAPHVAVGGTRIDRDIRTARVSAAVSAVSAVPSVRQALVAHQQRLVAAAGDAIVVEGRDIGTVVAPDAALKVFLTASPEARARRRSRQNAAADAPADEEALRRTAEAMRRRDTYDSSRADSPLRPADDAVVLDSTELGIDEVVHRVLDLAQARAGRP